MTMIQMMTKFLLMFFVFSINILCAEIEEYFKKPKDKFCLHQLSGIDFIYLINLDQRPEKFASCVQELSPYAVYPYRFSAVNGWELSLEAISDLGIKYESWMTSGHWGTSYPLDAGGEPAHEIVHYEGKNYFSHCMTRGAIGIVLSHLSILQDAYDSQYETIWVMEDDIEVIRDPNTLPELIAELDGLVGKDGWDVLFTDRDTKNSNGNYVPCTAYAWRPNFCPSNPNRFTERMDISNNFMRIGGRYGAYSMIVRRSGMKKLLRFIKNYHIFLPYDMEYTMPNDMRLFAVRNDVVSTKPRSPSDNGAPSYKNREPLLGDE